MKRTLAAVVATLALLGACGDDDDDDASADPTTRVEQAEADLAEATEAFDAATEQFCADASTYVEAVDAYGGVLTDAEATVGTVTSAGADLEEPREDVDSSIGDVQAARDDVVAAEVELAAAREEVETGTSAEDDDSSETTEPLVPEATVERIEQAETDLADAFDGLDESTPLSEAGEQVNAAAVSVEVAWLQLLAGAGCLSDEARSDAVAAVATFTTELQAALTTLEYFSAEIDGVYGPEVVAAVEQFQTDNELPDTGLVDRATAAALEDALVAAGVEDEAEARAHTAAVQTILTLTGDWTGPVDGEWSDELTVALESFQTDLGVEPTGVVDAATIAAAQQALEDASEESSDDEEQDDEEQDDEDDASTTSVETTTSSAP